MTNENTSANTTKNYTPEMEREMSEIYSENPTQETVQELARKYDKTENSVRSKLVSLGVYVAQEKKAANKGRVTKAQMASDIAGHLFGDESNTQGLENANAAALRIFLNPERVENYLESLRGE